MFHIVIYLCNYIIYPLIIFEKSSSTRPNISIASHSSKTRMKSQKKPSSKPSSQGVETKMTPTKRSIALDDSKPASSKKKRNSKKTSNKSTTKKPEPTTAPTQPTSAKKMKKKKKKKKKKNKNQGKNKETRATSTVASTPPSAQSKRSTTSLLGEEVTKLKVGSRTKPSAQKIKVHRPVDPSKLRPAHAIEWKTETGLNAAIMCNYPTMKKKERKSKPYNVKLAMLVSLYGPKELLSVFGLICVAKGIDFEAINVNVEFATRAKASKLFIDTCMIAEDVVSIDDSSDDDDCNRYVFIFSDLILRVSYSDTFLQYSKWFGKEDESQVSNGIFPFSCFVISTN